MHRNCWQLRWGVATSEGRGRLFQKRQRLLLRKLAWLLHKQELYQNWRVCFILKEGQRTTLTAFLNGEMYLLDWLHKIFFASRLCLWLGEVSPWETAKNRWFVKSPSKYFILFLATLFKMKKNPNYLWIRTISGCRLAWSVCIWVTECRLWL